MQHPAKNISNKRPVSLSSQLSELVGKTKETAVTLTTYVSHTHLTTTTLTHIVHRAQRHVTNMVLIRNCWNNHGAMHPHSPSHSQKHPHIIHIPKTRFQQRRKKGLRLDLDAQQQTLLNRASHPRPPRRRRQPRRRRATKHPRGAGTSRVRLLG